MKDLQCSSRVRNLIRRRFAEKKASQMIPVLDDGRLLIERDASNRPGNASVAAFGGWIYDPPGLNLPLASMLFHHASNLAPAVELIDGAQGGIDHSPFLLISRRRRPRCVPVRAAREDR
jgi:hypothetical protein